MSCSNEREDEERKSNNNSSVSSYDDEEGAKMVAAWEMSQIIGEGRRYASTNDDVDEEKEGKGQLILSGSETMTFGLMSKMSKEEEFEYPTTLSIPSSLSIPSDLNTLEFTIDQLPPQTNMKQSHSLPTPTQPLATQAEAEAAPINQRRIKILIGMTSCLFLMLCISLGYIILLKLDNDRHQWKLSALQLQQQFIQQQQQQQLISQSTNPPKIQNNEKLTCTDHHTLTNPAPSPKLSPLKLD
eukprot:7759391-Ditylum_brightwellii.AAC.1